MHSTKITGLSYIYNDLDVIVCSEREITCFSSAAIHGGWKRTKTIINHHVPNQFSLQEFNGTEERIKVKYCGAILSKDPVIFLTAVGMEFAQIVEFSIQSIPCLLIVTAGTTNANSPLDKPQDLFPVKDEIKNGTINSILVIDTDISEQIYGNLFILLTEAKTTVLQSLGIKTSQANIATGTNTDAIAVGSIKNSQNKKIEWSGLATEFGHTISQVYMETLKKALEDGGYI